MVAKLIIALNALLYLPTIATWIIIPDEFLLNVSVTVFNLAFTALLIIYHRQKLAPYYLSGYFKNCVSYSTSAFLLFCILGLVNYLSFKNPLNFDFTKDGRNSLTAQTRQVLERTAGPVMVKVFSRKSEFDLIRSLLDLYRFEKNDITLQFIDVELKPQLVSRYNIIKSPSIVLEQDKKKELVSGMDERSVTNAFINLSRKEKPLIYYSVGHQELNISSGENNGGNRLSRAILDMSYNLRKINLNTISDIPSSVKALAIWGPKSGFFENEIKIIDRYLRKGGKLLIALDPSLKDDKIKGLRKYLKKKWNLGIVNNYVIDRIKHVNGSNGSVPIVSIFDKDHPITKEMDNPVFFPLVSSVQKINNSANVTILAHSTPFPASWAENSQRELLAGKVTYGEKDFEGPVGYMGVWQQKGTKTRIVAYGNSSFVNNVYNKFPRNYMLFLNSLSWLVDEDHILSFDNNVIKDSPVFLSSYKLGLIFYFSVFFAPMILFAVAIFVYRRRIKL